MKRILLLLLAVLAVSPAIWADAKNKKGAQTAAAKDNEVHWLTIDEVQVKMKEQPKKVYIDIYTDWCGWCKKMEATTFRSPDFVKYMNDNYYCVRLNAERKDTLRFAGRMFYFDPAQRANTLAVALLQGKMSYPTSVIMEENFTSANPIPGYQELPTMEEIVRYFGDNIYKKQNWADYQKAYVATWHPLSAEVLNAPVPGSH
jgi:thioredoxin-related protein